MDSDTHSSHPVDVETKVGGIGLDEGERRRSGKIPNLHSQ